MRGDTSQSLIVTAPGRTHKLEPSSAGLAVKPDRGNHTRRDEESNSQIAYEGQLSALAWACLQQDRRRTAVPFAGMMASVLNQDE